MLPSLLLQNASDGGHWISVSVCAELGGGTGTLVAAYEAGGLGEEDQLIASSEIVASAGYTSGNELIAHLGLGDVTEVDLEVSPPGHEQVAFRDVPVDRHLRLPAGC